VSSQLRLCCATSRNTFFSESISSSISNFFFYRTSDEVIMLLPLFYMLIKLIVVYSTHLKANKIDWKVTYENMYNRHHHSSSNDYIFASTSQPVVGITIGHIRSINWLKWTECVHIAHSSLLLEIPSSKTCIVHLVNSDQSTHNISI